jgi:hypothetical protein
MLLIVLIIIKLFSGFNFCVIKWITIPSSLLNPLLWGNFQGPKKTDVLITLEPELSKGLKSELEANKTWHFWKISKAQVLCGKESTRHVIGQTNFYVLVTKKKP